MTFHILGGGGMLGRYVSTYLHPKHSVINYSREQMDISYMSDRFPASPGDVVVNCAGVIKTEIQKAGIEKVIKINSLAPHTLSALCTASGANLIHITTDCVFSGKDGKYSESSVHDALDVYGKSKSLGEPQDCTVIRTSIIGEEKENKRSLVEWTKAQAGKEANGYTNHLWNGITCLQFAKCVEEIAETKLYWKGVRHIHSPEDVSKFELLQLINDAYGLNIFIKKFTTAEKCDRTLRTEFPTITIPSLKDQILEMRKFKL